MGSTGQHPVKSRTGLAEASLTAAFLLAVSWRSQRRGEQVRGGSRLSSVARLQVYPIDVEIGRSSRDKDEDGLWTCYVIVKRSREGSGD